MTAAYDVFVSYAHRDNPQGQVRELRDAIVENFQLFAGRELSVFFDEQAIPSMSAWEQRIAEGLRESRLFLAVLSPNYFESPYCQRELEEYVRYEAMRHCLGDGVAPVYFIELPGRDAEAEENNTATRVKALRKRQWCDLTRQTPVLLPWHQVGRRALEDQEVARRLKELKEQMAERLSRADRARTSPTNIYRHNPQFVGRVRELTLLREALNERGSVGVVGHGATTVHGLGGLGKTELALAYAHAFAWDYPGGRWLAQCEGIDDFDLVLAQFATPLGIQATDAEQKNMHLLAERVLAALRQRDRSLLLLDNVTHPELLGPSVLMRLPAQAQVHLLASTRLGPAQLVGSPQDHAFVAVDELPAADALALVRAHQPGNQFTGPEEEVAARELVDLLGGFTLAIETAAIHLGREQAIGAIGRYVGLLRTELLAMSESAAADPAVGVRHKEKLLEATLKMTLDTLSPAQQHLLALASLLPADQVVLPWLRSLASERFHEVNPFMGTEHNAAWSRMLAPLMELRLFQPGNDDRIVRMHRLVQELVKKRGITEQGSLEEVFTAKIQGHAVLLAENWLDHDARWELTAMVNYALQLMNSESENGMLIAGIISPVLQELGRWAEKERLLRKAVEQAERFHGDKSDVFVSLLSNLALVLRAAGQLSEAERLMRKVLAIDEQVHGPDHEKVAVRLHNLGSLLMLTNQLPEAEATIRRALQIFETKNGPDHPKVAMVLGGLGELFQRTERYGEAEPLLRRALAIEEKHLGPDHPTVGKTLSNLARALMRVGPLEEAERTMRRGLELLEKHYGPEHSEVASLQVSLADILKRTDQLAEAESLLRQALTVDEKHLGPEHYSLAITIENLAAFLADTGRVDEAEPLFERGLAITERSLGPDHPDVAITLYNIAQLSAANARYAHAEQLLARSLCILLRSGRLTGHAHGNLQMVRESYEHLLSVMGRTKDQVRAQLNKLNALSHRR